MAALLSCGMESTDRISEHVDDARRQDIEVLAPNVNSSEVEFAVVGDKIAFGMGAIKGVGENALQAIVDARNEDGPFKDIFDLTERVRPKGTEQVCLGNTGKSRSTRQSAGESSSATGGRRPSRPVCDGSSQRQSQRTNESVRWR